MKFDFLRNQDTKSSLEFFLFIIRLLVMFTIGLISLYFFLELGEEISESSFVVEIDDFILKINLKKHESLEIFLILITHLASWKSIIVISSIIFLYLIIKRKYYLAIELVLVTSGSITVNVLLKNIFNRPRPVGEHIVEVISSSFPSGHSMVGLAVYGFCIYMLWVILDGKLIKLLISLLLVLLILLIGFSRVYLKVHYPSDVIGGFAAGLFWIVFCISIVHISKFFIKRKFITKK